MTDLPGGLLSGVGNLVGGVLGGVNDLVGDVMGGATQVVARTGDTLGSIADAHGVPLSVVVEANPQVLHPDLVRPGQAISVPQPGPSATSAAAAPETSAPAQAPVSVTIGQGSADFRVLAQAAPPLAPTLAATPGSLTLMQALAQIDPALAQLLAGALASPTLSTPATAAQLAKLETALLSLGWAAVALGLAKPGDVVLLLREAMLQAARVPPEGLALQPQTDGDAPSGGAPTRALAPPPGSPSGVDVGGPQRLRGRPPGEGDLASSKVSPDREREPAESPQRAWIARALPTALAVKARWGVPVAVTIAQGALASDWGRAAFANDYFGLLSERRSGRLAPLARPARVPALRGADPVAFEGVDDAAEAFGAFVSETPVFARAFRAPDAKTFARRLGEAGFSGDPAHGERLAEVIDTYALNALDG